MTTSVPPKVKMIKGSNRAMVGFAIILALISTACAFELLYHTGITSTAAVGLLLVLIISLIEMFAIIDKAVDFCYQKEVANPWPDEDEHTHEAFESTVRCCPICCHRVCSAKEAEQVIANMAATRPGRNNTIHRVKNGESLWLRGPEQKPSADDGGIS